MEWQGTIYLNIKIFCFMVSLPIFMKMARFFIFPFPGTFCKGIVEVAEDNALLSPLSSFFLLPSFFFEWKFELMNGIIMGWGRGADRNSEGSNFASSHTWLPSLTHHPWCWSKLTWLWEIPGKWNCRLPMEARSVQTRNAAAGAWSQDSTQDWRMSISVATCEKEAPKVGTWDSW